MSHGSINKIYYLYLIFYLPYARESGLWLVQAIGLFMGILSVPLILTHIKNDSELLL